MIGTGLLRPYRVIRAHKYPLPTTPVKAHLYGVIPHHLCGQKGSRVQIPPLTQLRVDPGPPAPLSFNLPLPEPPGGKRGSKSDRAHPAAQRGVGRRDNPSSARVAPLRYAHSPLQLLAHARTLSVTPLLHRVPLRSPVRCSTLVVIPSRIARSCLPRLRLLHHHSLGRSLSGALTRSLSPFAAPHRSL